jgi:holo-[acyl-carrier protein] synthase
MIFGIGTDIVLVSRIRQSEMRFGDRFAQRILAEIEFSDYKKASAPTFFLAKRFAAKEAVAKALGTGMRSGVTFRSIEIQHNHVGKPKVVLWSGAAKMADSLGIQHWHISLSDEKDHALAFVVAESD